MRALMESGNATVTSESQTVTFGDRVVAFEINPETRERLLNGLDDIALTLAHADDIDRFEQANPPRGPMTTSVSS